MNLSNDIFILVTMVVSVFIIWHGFRRELKDSRKRIQSNAIGLIQLNIIANAQLKQLITTAAVIFTTYLILRVPLYIYGRMEITSMPLGLSVCNLLYESQFCTHFLIYAIIQTNYRRAYYDMLRLPRCTKEQTSDNNTNTVLKLKNNKIKEQFVNT